MSFVRRILRKPVQAFRKLAGQPLTPLETAIQFCIYNNIQGDYLEFGVFVGSSFSHAYKYFHSFQTGYATRNGLIGRPDFQLARPRFFAFDSFVGLPAAEQGELPAHWRGKGAMSYPQQLFTQNIERAGVDLRDVVIVPGFFDASLTDAVRQQHNLTAAAIVHADCDLYESTVPVLDFIRPIFVDGCVVVFDDWFYYKGHPARGQRGAFENWLARNPDVIASQLASEFPTVAFILNHK
jgi:hypothetical protein